MKTPKTAVLLINLLGLEAALKFMAPKAYGGKTFHIPKFETGRSEETFARLVDCMGVEAATKLCKTWGGERPYIPRMDTALDAERQARNCRIVQEYTGGKSVFDLATQETLSDRQIKTILKETDLSAQAQSVEPGNQAQLF